MIEGCVDASIAVKLAVKGEPFRAKARLFLSTCGDCGHAWCASACPRDS